ncbi:MAG: helix-turn-helix domain-containing protein [Acidobacteriota bacterium]
MDRVLRPSLPTATVGQLLRHHRLQRHLTQTELARQIGIQQSDLSRMEKGEYRVSLDVLFRILQVFELSLGEFFGDLVEQHLTSRESELVESFRVLAREDQDEVLQFVEFKRNRSRERDE